MTEQTEQSIVKADEPMALAAYGDRREVRELARRLQMTLPGGQKYNEIEALTLAQISVAHELDPFNGEIWLIKDQDSGKVYGALVGLKGHRKHAKKQANYWGAGNNGGFTRVTDPEKIKEYGANHTDIVYEYRIVDVVTLAGWTKQAGQLRRLGMDLNQITSMIGGPPVTMGVGVYTAGERTKMKPHQCAMFRAEKDALKRRFDVRFRFELEGGDAVTAQPSGDESEEPGMDEIEDGYSDFVDATARDEDELLEELGIAPPPEPETPAPALYQQLVDMRLAENEYAAKGMMDKRSKSATLQPIPWARAYRGWRDMGAKVEQAAKYANEGTFPT